MQKLAKQKPGSMKLGCVAPSGLPRHHFTTEAFAIT
jgi:hypothetical protein